MKCIHCYKDIPERSVYCNHCGKQQVMTSNQIHKDRIRPYLRTLNNRDAYLFVHLFFFIVLFLASFSSLGKLPLTHVSDQYPVQIRMSFNVVDMISGLPYLVATESDDWVKDQFQEHARAHGSILGMNLNLGSSYFESLDYIRMQQIKSHMETINPFLLYASSDYKETHQLEVIFFLGSAILMMVYLGTLLVFSYRILRAIVDHRTLPLTNDLLNLVILSLIVSVTLRLFGAVSGYEMTGYPKTVFTLPLIAYVLSVSFDFLRSQKTFVMQKVFSHAALYILLMLVLNSVFAFTIRTEYQFPVMFGTDIYHDHESLFRYLPSLLKYYTNGPQDSVFLMQSTIDTIQSALLPSIGSRMLDQFMHGFDQVLSSFVIIHEPSLNTILLIISFMQYILLIIVVVMIIRWIKSLNAEDLKHQESNSLAGTALFLSIMILAGMIYQTYAMNDIYQRLSYEIRQNVTFASFLIVIYGILMIQKDRILMKLEQKASK